MRTDLHIPRCLRLFCGVLITTATLAQAETSTLVITGSDTLAGLLTSWSAAFSEEQPDVAVEIQAAGSAAAPIALAEGTASLGAMSRRMSSEEIERFVARQGYLPTAIAVARDAIAVVVHPDNPVTELTRIQLDGIYSATRQCGGSPIERWGDVMTDSTMRRPIEAYGRTSISGSYGFFKREALCAGDFASRVVELPGFAAIVDAVATTPEAIAYVSAGFVNERVKVVPLVLSDGSRVWPDRSPLRGERPYPLARTLYLYLSIPPGTRASRRECDFLHFIASDKAQSRLRIEGFEPITRDDVVDEATLLGGLDVCP